MNNTLTIIWTQLNSSTHIAISGFILGLLYHYISNKNSVSHPLTTIITGNLYGLSFAIIADIISRIIPSPLRIVIPSTIWYVCIYFLMNKKN